jgi:hypothetical protein
MILPGKLDLTLLRWQPFNYTIDFPGIDFTGATFKAEFRQYTDAPDPALISLANASSPSQGISVTVADVDGVTVSSVELRITEATIEGLPFTNPRGTDFLMVWDLVITGGGFPKTRWIQGNAPVHGGSTQT